MKTKRVRPAHIVPHACAMREDQSARTPWTEPLPWSEGAVERHQWLAPRGLGRPCRQRLAGGQTCLTAMMGTARIIAAEIAKGRLPTTKLLDQLRLSIAYYS